MEKLTDAVLSAITGMSFSIVFLLLATVVLRATGANHATQDAVPYAAGWVGGLMTAHAYWFMRRQAQHP